MYRWIKWIAPTVAGALVIGFSTISSIAQESPTTAPAGTSTVTVTVLDADGKPVADAKVSLLPPKVKKSKKTPAADGAAPAKAAKAAALATGTTDADGKVTLSGIPAGDFPLTAKSKTAGSGKSTVAVSAGQDANASITLTPKAAAPGAASATTQPAPQ